MSYGALSKTAISSWIKEQKVDFAHNTGVAEESAIFTLEGGT
jgi:hypothetical protein